MCIRDSRDRLMFDTTTPNTLSVELGMVARIHDSCFNAMPARTSYQFRSYLGVQAMQPL